MAKERFEHFRQRTKLKKGEVPKEDIPTIEEGAGPPATKHRKQRMIAALKDHMGIVSYSCESVGISVATHYRWMKEDANYREGVLAAEDRMVGFAERKILELVKAGDREATKFVLDRKGGRHGWNSKLQISGVGPGGSIPVDLNVDERFLSEEAPLGALKQIVSTLENVEKMVSNLPSLANTTAGEG